MLKDIVKGFKNALDNNPEIVLENYTLKEGLYISFDIHDKLDNYKYIVVKKKNETIKDDQYKWFRERDYYSSILDDDMNKAVDIKKQIHSTNEFSLFIKKDNFPGFNSEAMTDSGFYERIDGYFNSLKELDNKYWDIYDKSDIKKKQKYSRDEFFDKYFKDEIEYLVSDERKKRLEDARNFFKNNLAAIQVILKDINSKEPYEKYVKIFFDENISDYKRAYQLYITPRIFNKNDFNATIDNKIMGLPANNITANDKKPYLLLRTMKAFVPTRVTFDEAIANKDFFLWLKSQEKSDINIDYNYKYDMAPENSKNNPRFEIYVNKKEVVIEDYDNIPFPQSKKTFEVKNYLNITDKDNVTLLGKLEVSRGQLMEMISDMFFAGEMEGYFKKLELKVKANVFTDNMQSLFFISRDAIYDFIVLGVEEPFSNMVDRITLDSIKDQLLYTVKGIPKKMGEAYNLRLALLEYFNKGGKEMGDCINNITCRLKEKLQSKQEVVCESDEEFFFILGQLTYYILYQSEAKNKNYGMVEPFIHSRNAQDLKNKLKNIFNIYKHAIGLHSYKFNNAFSMIMGYECTSKFSGKMQDLYYAGLMTNNILLAKNEQGNEEEVNNEK